MQVALHWWKRCTFFVLERASVTTPSGRKLLDVIWLSTRNVLTQTYEFSFKFKWKPGSTGTQVFVCVCKVERKWNKNLVMVTLPKRLKGSLTSSDSWIHSLTMSTRENVVLEGRTKELTSTTCMWNAQNIQVFLHSHESFSICAAGHEIFISTVAPEGPLTTFSFEFWCQRGTPAVVSQSTALSPLPTFAVSFKFITIKGHWKAPCYEYIHKDRSFPPLR